jgi:hypothetical protein
MQQITKVECLVLVVSGIMVIACGIHLNFDPAPSDSDSSEDISLPKETGPGGFPVNGKVLDLLTHNPAAEGLCVYAADPTGAIAGGNIMDSILAETVVGSGGAYELSDIVTTSSFGLLFLVQDCDSEGAVMPTATDMGRSTYSSLQAGDVISDYTIYSVDIATKNTFQSLLTVAGYTGNLDSDGALLGFVEDNAGTPVGGAVVTGPASSTTYYFYGKGFNTTGTVAAAGSMFIIPGPPVYFYSCAAKGYTFDNVMAYGLPGYIDLVEITAK